MNKTSLKRIIAIDDAQKNGVIINSFLVHNGLSVSKGLLYDTTKETTEVIAGITTIEDVIEAFETVIPSDHKTSNGAIYTPKFIRDYIVAECSKTNKKFYSGAILDPACGCGAFLYSAAEMIFNQTKESFRDIYRRIYGVDISSGSVLRSKVLLALLALQANNEELYDVDFRIYKGNSLSFNFAMLPGIKENGGYDVILGNPPYVRAKNIDEDSKELLKNWETAKQGNPDLYIPFFEIGIKLLKPDGVLGYITLNSFFKSVNGRSLRHFFSTSDVDLTILDFGNELVFKKKMAYTCIVFAVLSPSKGIKYSKVTSEMLINKLVIDLTSLAYSQLDHHKGWNLNNAQILSIVEKIENTGVPLGEQYTIRNGIATLANSTYIFKPKEEDCNYYYRERLGELIPIEKEICRDIIKPNVLKDELEIEDFVEKIIFPYTDSYEVLTETIFKTKFPKAYEFLLSEKELLAKRDKGNLKVSEWFEFGRSQALTDTGKKLLFPYMADVPRFIFTDNEQMLIYCGYAIFHNDQTELLILKRILESSVFDFYIRNTSKPYASGYYSYAKNYVKGFGVYQLSASQKQEILSLTRQTEINAYVESLYEISFDK